MAKNTFFHGCIANIIIIEDISVTTSHPTNFDARFAMAIVAVIITCIYLYINVCEVRSFIRNI